MKKNRLLLIAGLFLIAALALTACTATSGDIQGAIEQAATQVGPTVQAAVEELAPTLEAAATELAPTVDAAVEELAPTVEAAATAMAEEPAAEEATGDLMVVSADCEAEGYTGLFQEIAAIDPLTVQFSMCSPDPAFPSKAAFTSFAIQPSEYLESTGGTGDLLEKPIGTGPYMVENWSLSLIHI